MTLIYFILVLGITVLIHEFGHFIFAKRAGVYVYEFSIGMGPKLFSFSPKKSETKYSIRLLPIGGYVSMAGEEMEIDRSIPEGKQLYSKKWYQRFLIIVAGVLFNFILAIVLLFIIGLINGTTTNEVYVNSIEPEYPAYNVLYEGEQIIGLDGIEINSAERLTLELQVRHGEPVEFTVIDKEGKTDKRKITPIAVEEDGNTNYYYGFSLTTGRDSGIIASIKYAFSKTLSLLEQMVLIIVYLVTGKLSLNSLAGPVGIFNIVGETAKAGVMSLTYLVAYLCINVGFINLIPLPAFDGGRLLFLIIEKIKGSKIKPEIENKIHSIGFILLMILMITITYNDIVRLFT